MSAAKARRSTAKTTTRKAAGKAVKGAARSAAKGAARAATSTAVAAGQQTGGGTRWTEAQVKLLLDTVDATDTAKEAFEKVAGELGKSAGTVAQKYYNLLKGGGGSSLRRGAGATRSTGARGAASGGLPSAAQLRDITVDELTGLASRVKVEIDRRRTELDVAAEQLKG